MPNSIQMALRVPPSLFEKLKLHAQNVNVTKTEVVLSALAQYLNSTEDVPTSVKVAQLEKRVGELEVLVKGQW
ncbi:hypothetical protein [Gloeothece verrucosa]|uniref:CopG domain protein DNA-binding domain protein n=1 Tax=Gloeothece verrucosa (strain PCC 7822) TaxID=497965 RepID=E0UEM0_GLOV7|nr:hypothetical protein [Gloeothece verrucosa]ADN16588.1 conserved hypothetical protein [Gloeothece verrucosa PCC 7822]